MKSYIADEIMREYKKRQYFKKKAEKKKKEESGTKHYKVGR